MPDPRTGYGQAGGIATESWNRHFAKKVFHGPTPNALDKLVFSFVPIKSYACLNAIEVVDESR